MMIPATNKIRAIITIGADDPLVNNHPPVVLPIIIEKLKADDWSEVAIAVPLVT